MDGGCAECGKVATCRIDTGFIIVRDGKELHNGTVTQLFSVPRAYGFFGVFPGNEDLQHAKRDAN